MESVGSLLNQGLIMTGLGMTLVFGALALLWGIITLLGRLFPQRGPLAAAARVEPEEPPEDPAAVAARTAERARVAALVAGAFMANALPMPVEAPPGPVYEHGRSAPSWVTARRAHVLQPWQPRRRP